MGISWLRPALPAGAIFVSALILLSMAAQPVQADANELRIAPGSVRVAPGGSVELRLIADPPPTTLTLWAIDILFDPAVVSTDDSQCQRLDPLPNSQTIGACLVTPTTEGGPDSVVKVLGGMIFNETEDGHQAGDGLSELTVLADITFDAVGGPGTCSDLRLFVRFHTDVDAEETNPQLFDGRICIEGDAPASGTEVPTEIPGRTTDPTPPGGDASQPTFPPPDAGTNPPGNADQTPAEASDDASPGQTGSQTGAGASAGSQTAEDGVDSENDDDGDGDSGFIFWALLGVGALLVVCGGAWAVVRSRGGQGDAGGES